MGVDRSDFDYERLMRSLQDEINWRAEETGALRGLRDSIKSNRDEYTAEGWAQVGHQIVDRLTHRSNVHATTMAYSCSMLAAHAAAAYEQDRLAAL